MANEVVSRPQHLRASLSEWYRPGTDNSIYENALRQCRESNAGLAKMLPPDEVLLLSGNPNCPNLTIIDAQVVKSFIQDKANDAKDRRDRSKPKWLSSFVNTLACFALKIQDIVTPLASQSPECAIPLGCLMVIFKKINVKQEKQEKVFEIFEKLLQITDSLELCSILFPTDKMREQLAKTYIDVLDLMVQATEYCAIGRISRLVDALTANEKYDFDKSLQKVKSSWKALRVLTQASSCAMQAGSHELLRDQVAVINGIANQCLIMASDITSLRSSLYELQINQNRMHTLQVRLYSDSLINTLLPSNRTAKEELQLWQHREFRLSPKDHWEVNGILAYLEEWNSLPHASILAVLGPTRDRDSWVTEFILDTIQAFQVQNDLVTFVMCDRLSNEHYTPGVLIKTIICQILEQKPTLILEEPEIFNSRAFQQAAQFTQACALLERIIARLAGIVILVDRIDHCQSDLSDPQAELFGFFARLIRIHGKRIKIIVTSTDPTAGEFSPDFPISICQISTRRTPSAINYRRPKRLTILHFINGVKEQPKGLFYEGRKNPYAVFERSWDEIINMPEYDFEFSSVRLERRKII